MTNQEIKAADQDEWTVTISDPFLGPMTVDQMKAHNEPWRVEARKGLNKAQFKIFKTLA